MKKKEVIIGKVIAVTVLIVVIIYNFLFELPHVLFTSIILFCLMLFTLCVIGDKKRNKRDGS
ncbi:MAG: hypothetical protein GX022_08435 [Clostridiaceae bacterium]|nr:hypothetical protein [Clostridiaceae bacterium]